MSCRVVYCFLFVIHVTGVQDTSSANRGAFQHEMDLGNIDSARHQRIPGRTCSACSVSAHSFKQ